MRSERLQTVLPPVYVSAEFRELWKARLGSDIGATMTRTCFATRGLARDVAKALPMRVDTLACDGVEVVSMPFFDELLNARPELAFTDMNEDVTESLALVRERHA